MSKEQELKEMLKLYSKQDLWNRIQEKQAMIYDLEAKLAESERNNLILYSMLYQILEKQGYENITSTIEQMTGLMLEKQADWFKGNRNYDQLKQQLAEKEKIIKDIENKNYYGIMNKDTKKLKNTAGLDVDVFDDIIISSDLEKIKQHIHIDYLYNCVPVKIVLEELC